MLLNSRNVYNKKSFEIGLTAFELNSISLIEDWKNEFSINDIMVLFGLVLKNLFIK